VNLSDTSTDRATLPDRTPRKLLPHDAVTIRLVTKHSGDRRGLEARIAAHFSRRYGARIDAFLPYLVSPGIEGRHGAVLGLRPAREAPLFLEQYFEGPIEQAISLAFHTPVSRDQVVEVGNLAAAVPGAVAMLFGILAAILHEAGMRWVVCTATPRVRSILDDLDLQSRTLRAADPAAPGRRRVEWGNCYAHRPRVIAGEAEIRRLVADLLIRDGIIN
jgi:Thermostable hemolysin